MKVTEVLIVFRMVAFRGGHGGEIFLDILYKKMTMHHPRSTANYAGNY